MKSMMNVNQTPFTNANTVKQPIAVMARTCDKREMSFKFFRFLTVLYIWGIKLKNPTAVPRLSNISSSRITHQN